MTLVLSGSTLSTAQMLCFHFFKSSRKICDYSWSYFDGLIHRVLFLSWVIEIDT